MRLYVVETRVKNAASGEWTPWIPSVVYVSRVRDAMWHAVRKLRASAPAWLEYRTKPWVREVPKSRVRMLESAMQAVINEPSTPDGIRDWLVAVKGRP